MIIYLDDALDLKPHGDLFMLEGTSGGERVQLMTTRHGALKLQARAAAANAKAAIRDMEAGASVIPFPKVRRKRRTS